MFKKYFALYLIIAFSYCYNSNASSIALDEDLLLSDSQKYYLITKIYDAFFINNNTKLKTTKKNLIKYIQNIIINMKPLPYISLKEIIDISEYLSTYLNKNMDESFGYFNYYLKIIVLSDAFQYKNTDKITALSEVLKYTLFELDYENYILSINKNDLYFKIYDMHKFTKPNATRKIDELRIEKYYFYYLIQKMINQSNILNASKKPFIVSYNLYNPIFLIDTIIYNLNRFVYLGDISDYLLKMTTNRKKIGSMQILDKYEINCINAYIK